MVYLTLSNLLKIFVLTQTSYYIISNADELKSCGFESIYQLGDSLSDTGNLIREASIPFCARAPYGESFNKRSVTGRCSDGQLVIDYFALSAGVPLLNPYLAKNGSFDNGVNFAVSGSTALSSDALMKKGIISPFTNSSLGVQLGWMESYFNSTQSETSLVKIGKSLFMVGEIGGNDFNYALVLQRWSIANAKSNLLPDVIQSIKDAVKRVIGYGAKWIIVPGNFPLGCAPNYLGAFKTNDSSAYDQLGCLKYLNDFAMYYNDRLKAMVNELKGVASDVSIVYGDNYNAMMWILQHARSMGFEVVNKSCCGIGGDYNFDLLRMCSNPGVPVCPNPNTHISWDGIHMTQQTHQYLSQWLINDIVPKLKCV